RKKAILLSANGEGTSVRPNADVSSLMQTRMFQLFSEIERQMIRDRTRAALHVKRLRNERIGVVPYGWRLAQDGLHLEVAPEEQRIVCMVMDLRQQRKTYA